MFVCFEKEAFGFSLKRINRPCRLVASTGSSTTSLRVGGSLQLSDEDAALLMQHARECAVSDSCSITDAKAFLQEILQVQREPVESEDALEIASTLRAKIGREGTAAMNRGYVGRRWCEMLSLCVAYHFFPEFWPPVYLRCQLLSSEVCCCRLD